MLICPGPLEALLPLRAYHNRRNMAASVRRIRGIPFVKNDDQQSAAHGTTRDQRSDIVLQPSVGRSEPLRVGAAGDARAIVRIVPRIRHDE